MNWHRHRFETNIERSHRECLDCGEVQHKVSGKWKRVALGAEGEIVVLDCPYCAPDELCAFHAETATARER